MPDKPAYQELENRIFRLEHEIAALRALKNDADFGAAERLDDLYRFILYNITDAVFLTDTAGNFKYVCPRPDLIFGYSANEVAKLGNISALLGQELFSADQLNETGELKNIEKTAADKSGCPHPLLINIKQADISGNGILFVCKDISERRKREECLKKSEERYRLLAENLPDIVARFDRQLRHLYVNQQIESITGMPASAYIGKTHREVGMPEEVAARWESSLKQVFQTGRMSSVELAFPFPDGLRHFESRIIPEYKPNGALETALGITRDITERKRSEETLRFQAMLLNQIQDWITATDLQGRISYVNQAVCRALGKQPEELIGHPVSIYGEDTEMGASQQEIIEATLTHGQWSGEVVNFTNDGEKAIVNCRTHLVQDESGCPVAMVGISTDITERLRTEALLRQTRKLEAIGTLAGGIAHDFNNILGIIIGNTELAMDDMPEWNPARLNLEQIKTASLRAKDVVRQLLSFSRNAEHARKPIKINLLIKESIKLLRSSIPKSIEIRTHIPDFSGTIKADPTQIHQILINLCMNATHAMEENGGILEISMHEAKLDQKAAANYHGLKPGTYLQLTVSDTGHGIAPEIMDKIFDPYFTTKEVGKGTGMGLAVVHGIVKNHDGAIWVDSAPGAGAAFNILFPVVDALPLSANPAPDDLPTGNESVLFVDDEELLVDIMFKTLKRLGYQVQATTNPVEAFEIFRENPNRFDLIITDMAMPLMSGEQLVQAVLKVRSDIPIILCTGYSEKVNEAKAKSMGVRQYLEKPFDSRKLAETIRQVLDQNKR